MGRTRREFLASKYSAGIISAKFFEDEQQQEINTKFFTAPSELPDDVFKASESGLADGEFACAQEELTLEEQQLYTQLLQLEYLKAINSKLKFFVILIIISLVIGIIAGMVHIASLFSVY